MTWFKVDDGFYDHPKFLDVPNAAVGLWVKAGAWCGKHLTDGVIPARQVKRFKGTAAQINALLSARIWVESECESGAKAYRFHDWNEYQPTREEKAKEREDAAERQRKSRERKRQEQEEQENVTRDSHVTGSRDSHVTGSPLSQRPDPTRPDPTIKREVVGLVTDRARDVAPSSENLIPDGPSVGAGAPPPGAYGTIDDPRCREHKDLPRDQVPPCRACATAKQTLITHQRNTHQQRTQLLQSCQWCDERGIIPMHDTAGNPVAVKCDHTHYPETPQAPAAFTPQRTTKTPTRWGNRKETA